MQVLDVLAPVFLMIAPGAVLQKTAFVSGNFLKEANRVTSWLGAVELKVRLILLACPTAIVSYTMALELKGDEALASGTIVLSVLVSVVSLAVIVGTL